ncbi:hypothetical protein Poli38472_014176 [Pythium oligandrum]|uniref:Tyrosine decarboxylase n=1 Tax=Pythium oligandrum TaxID=41045 RepID=A0A8K1CI90_PYTOL|nr:hypothetical protein Poli38472_014176 [Pythium oligandrum]|eukprot:TMW64059.1 hypothetical protein Poli38472_014176 [Pythium oligandrum]
MSSSSSASSTTVAATAFCAGALSGVALYAALERVRRQRALASTAPLDPRNVAAMREPAAAVTDLIVQYMENLYRKDKTRGSPKSSSYAVRAQIEPDSIKKQLPLSCPETPESYEDIFRDCKDIIFPGLTHWASPDFFAYFKIHGSEPSVLADYLGSALNVIGFSWVAAPAATELEQVVCDWMARLLGLPECFLSTTVGGGVIQGSASESALCAMIAARQAALEGLKGEERAARAAKLCAYVSDQTHSIGEKACMVLDIPHLRVVKTRRGAVDEDNYGLDAQDMAAAMAEDIAKGLVPFFLIPTVGTTSTTAIDPVRALARVAKQQPYPVWVHVDGAYGGAAAVCPEYQHWFDGVEECDSVCVNSHKWLMVCFGCSLLWVKDRRPLIQALALHPEYLKNDFMSQVQYKDWQVGLGRRFSSLKLWFTLRRFGAVGLQKHIRRSIEHAKHAERLLLADGRFRLFVPVRTALVCFHVAFGGRDLTETLLREVNASGRVFLIHSVVDGVFFLRLAIGGLEVDDWNIQNVVEVLSETLSSIIERESKWQLAYNEFVKQA